MLAWVGDQPGKRGRVGYAVLAALRWTGLRRNEITILRLDQVGLDARPILASLRPALAKAVFFSSMPSGA